MLHMAKPGAIKDRILIRLLYSHYYVLIEVLFEDTNGNLLFKKKNSILSKYLNV